MKRQKILHVVSVSFSINYFIGKQLIYIKNNKGVEFHIACSPSKELQNLSYELDFVPFEINISRKISPLEDIKAIILLYKYIKTNNFTKVVGHSPKGGMVSMIASFFANVDDRYYFRHGIFYETSIGFKRFLLKNIDRITGFFSTKVFCVSNSVKKISEFDKLNNPKKNTLLGLGTCNGVDTNLKYNPKKIDINLVVQLKKKYKISNGDFVIGFVGRIVKDKGIEELISAWEIIKSKLINVKLLLVGPIEDRDPISIETRFKIMNDSSIVFTDFVSETSPFYDLMDIFILPSYREGFPTVALEASSMELPVIITKATGCEEAIINNETGVFTSIDPFDIADKILYYYNNPKIIAKHGKKGRLFVQENFEQTKIWDAIIQEFNI